MVKLWQYSTIASGNEEPFAWQAAGMGYVIHTSANRFIVIDGGHEADAERLIELMKRESGKEKPEVALWILTHPHDDHVNALLYIADRQELKARLNIQQIAVSLPERFEQKRGADCSSTFRGVKQLSEKLNCAQICPEAGDVTEVDGLKLEFYFSWKDMECQDPNELSLVFRLSGSDRCELKKTVMFTGDAYESTLDIVLKNFKESQLKSDICQAAHHGLNGGNRKFYQAVDADIVLVPIAGPAYEAMLYGEYKEDPQVDANRLLMLSGMKPGKQLVRSVDGDFCIELG